MYNHVTTDITVISVVVKNVIAAILYDGSHHPVDPYHFCFITIIPSIPGTQLFWYVYNSMPSQGWCRCSRLYSGSHSISHSHPFSSISICPPIPQIRLLQDSILKINRQCDEWGERSKSHKASIRHLPFGSTTIVPRIPMIWPIEYLTANSLEKTFFKNVSNSIYPNNISWKAWLGARG